MPERSVTHDTFIIERDYDVPPARVFAAFADPKIKARWFANPEGWETTESAFDFRVGGQEINRGRQPDGPLISFDSRYQEIIPNERIIFAYNLTIGERLLSVSLTTVELKPRGQGTRLIFTEQGAFLDGQDAPQDRRKGTEDLLTALDTELARQFADS